MGEIHASFVTPAGSVLGAFALQSAPGDHGSPALVFGANQYLVVWVDRHGFTSSQVRGARVTTAGDVLDPAGFDVTAGAEADEDPAVSFDGERYLVAWMRDPTPSFIGADIWAARLELDGSPSDPAPIQIANGDHGVAPRVVFDGTDHFVVWEIESFAPPWGIHAARISPAGVLLDGPPNSQGLTIDVPSAATGLLSRPALVRGLRNTLLAWVSNVEASDQKKGIHGTLVYPFTSGSP